MFQLRTLNWLGAGNQCGRDVSRGRKVAGVVLQVLCELHARFLFSVRPEFLPEFDRFRTVSSTLQKERVLACDAFPLLAVAIREAKRFLVEWLGALRVAGAFPPACEGKRVAGMLRSTEEKSRGDSEDPEQGEDVVAIVPEGAAQR